MITRSKDGIYKPKALHAKATATPSAPPAATPTSTPNPTHFVVAKCAKPSSMQCLKSTKSGSSPKPDYTTTEPPTYKIAAQYPQWCSAMANEFAALQRQGTWVLVPSSPS